ncbi:MAG: N-acetylmuramic acid-6-phosphate etherase, partial [Bacteroidota bacterium]
MITESPSNHDHLESWTVRELLEGINAEDRRVPEAVAEAIPALEALVEALVPRMQQGGRLF